MNTGKLTFFCGKMGAGKSTRARALAKYSRAVLISEDDWLASLYPDEIASLEDYLRRSGRLKQLMKPLVQSILLSGTDVVMDFPANTVSQRTWFHGIFSEVAAAHELVVIDVPDALCLEQIAIRRRAHPERAATDTAEMFQALLPYFTMPAPEEGFMTSVSARSADQ